MRANLAAIALPLSNSLKNTHLDNYLEHKDTSAKCVSGHDFVTSTHSLK